MQINNWTICFKVINAQGKGLSSLLIKTCYGKFIEPAELKNITGRRKSSTKIKIDNKDFSIGAQILHDIDIF
jgi:hypothetical protein